MLFSLLTNDNHVESTVGSFSLCFALTGGVHEMKCVLVIHRVNLSFNDRVVTEVEDYS